ncbi:MAG: hypothetical protein AAFQ98_10570 [Bacteroidota bacterium]
MEKVVNPLKKFRNRWLLHLVGEALLFALAAACLGIVLAPWLSSSPALMAFLLAVLAVGLWFYGRQPHQVTPLHTADYLNRQHPELQDSAELVLARAEELSTLQRWQAQRVTQTLSEIATRAKVPHRLEKAALVFLEALLVSFALAQAPLPQATALREAGLSATDPQGATLAPLPAEIEAFTLTITPPAYMRLPVSQQNQLPLQVWAGSQANWSINFSQPVQRAVLLWGQGDTLETTPHEGSYELRRALTENSFYALAWQNLQGGWTRSDYAPIEVRQDAPPQVAVASQEPYLKLDYTPGIQVPIQLEYQDDFDITQSQIIATVARGQGESVRFREMQLSIPHPWSRVQRQEKVTFLLTLDSLEMTPGDELYFYVEALDNRQPERQRSRTEMYFVALRDTANNVIQMEGGLGVDLMPDYFRSQRQLIIDTEKLIADRKAGRVTEQEFKFLSNELGYDQKALRLKYGALLGLEDEDASSVPEEFEAPGATVDAYFQHEEDEEFRDDSHEHEEHDDDHEEEATSFFSRLVAEGFGESHDHEHDHGHDHESETPTEQENPLDAFIHAHDDSEEATFYAEGLKAKLRHALNEMWDAELHLRLYEPDKSLPYQYEALEMINDIRLDARVYVERVGFEPPPLKVAEVRLTGDQDEILGVKQGRSLAEQEPYPSFRAVLPVLETLRTRPRPVTLAEAAQLGLAGQTLAALAIDRPGDLLVALSFLKNLEEGSYSGAEQSAASAIVQASLLQCFPQPQPQVTGRSQAYTPLQQQWLQSEKGRTP